MKLLSRIRHTFSRIKATRSKKKDVLAIAIFCDGGVGDGLVHLNYAKGLKSYSGEQTEIDLYFKSAKVIERLYNSEDNYLHGYFDKKDLDGAIYHYDLIIRIKERLPMVQRASWRRLQTLNPKLHQLAHFYQQYFDRYRFYYDQSPRVDGFSHLLALIQNNNRVTQPDIGHKLGLTHLDITIHTTEDTEVLNFYGLQSQKFITFNRSIDNTSDNKDSTKLWPKNYYQELWAKIQKEHPNIKLVYIGPDSEDYIPNYVLNLSGKTSFNELLILLKHAKLHVGPEGGMIHMRHALCALPSCVLFGPTSVAFYGYPENINMEVGNVCISSCEWMVENWQSICIKNEGHICRKLLSLKPETVFSALHNQL